MLIFNTIKIINVIQKDKIVSKIKQEKSIHALQLNFFQRIGKYKRISFSVSEIDKLMSLAFVLLCVSKNQSKEISNNYNHYSINSFLLQHVG
jgi:hypothetical protein